jgi:hypothetical protein
MKSIEEVLNPIEETVYQCWVRMVHFPDEWIQIGARKLEYSTIGKFKSALKTSNTYFNPFDNPERYLEVVWVKVTKQVTKQTVKE